MTSFEIDPEASQVWIEGSSSVHPIHATALGCTGWLQVTMTRGALAASPKFDGEVRIAVDRLRSGNPLVDRETRRRIDASRHPEIVGTASSATRLAEHRLGVRGEIEFRGEVREVDGEVTLAASDDRVTVDGEARFDVRDWGLEPPRVALLKVHPEITVRIHLEGCSSAHRADR